jgi:hypothetical protein
MKIVEAESIKTTNHRGRKEISPVNKWLFDKEGKKVRLTALMGMEDGKAAIVELSEIQGYGTNKKSTRGFDNVLNRVFILGELPLIARRASDNQLIIKKLEKFDLEQYNKGDKKPMSDNQIETVKAKLAELS